MELCDFSLPPDHKKESCRSDFFGFETNIDFFFLKQKFSRFKFKKQQKKTKMSIANTWKDVLESDAPELLFFARPREFALKFENAKTPADIRAIVPMVARNELFAKQFYNKHMGWALPTSQVCENIVRLWQKYPHVRIVDVGAGSGLFCMMLHDAGIPADKLLAVDKETPIECWKTTNTYWDIYRNDTFDIPIDDVFFVAWGGSFGGLYERLNHYIDSGGWCVVILGETLDGCTLPSDYLVDDEDWVCTLIHVEGPASAYAEHLSINVRRSKVRPFFC